MVKGKLGERQHGVDIASTLAAKTAQGGDICQQRGWSALSGVCV